VFRIFHSNFPLVNGLIPLFLIPLLIPFWNTELIDFPFESIIDLNKLQFAPNTERVIAILVLSMQGAYLNLIINSSELYNRNSYLAGFLFVSISSPSVINYGITGALIAQFFILFAMHICYQIYRNKPSKELLFWASCSLGVGAIFYFPTLILALSLLIFLMFIRPFKWREYFFALTGALFALTLAYAINYLLTSEITLKTHLNGVYNKEMVRLKSYIFTSYALVVLIGGLSLIQNLNMFSIRGRKLVQSSIAFTAPLIFISTILVFTGHGSYHFAISLSLSYLIFSWYVHSKIPWLVEMISHSVYLSYILWAWNIL